MKENEIVKYISEENLKHIFLDFQQMEEFAKEPLVMKKAYGVWYEDIYGKKYLDGLSGVYVVNVGHGNKRVIEAIKKQLDEICFSPPLHSTNMKALELVKLIGKITPEDLNTVKLFSGGSEATEAAMKLARQYHKQTRNPSKFKVLSGYESFHGVTLGSLSATGITRRKSIFEPLLSGYIHFFLPKCYRCPYNLEYPKCDLLCARIVERIVKEEEPNTISSLIIEPICNTGGIITPPKEYLPILREICDKYNIIMIFDEIITGFGRTGNMFAAQTFKTTPDIICMGKGMASGYSPVGAIAFRDSIAEAFYGKEEEKVEFSHGHTFGGNPLSSVAAIATITEIIEENLMENARNMGEYLWKGLEELKDLGVIGEIRGKGLLIGIEFVKDVRTKERFEDKFGIKVGKLALKKGLIIRYEPNWAAFAPPLIVSKDELDMMVSIFRESIEEILREVKG
jgi:adenosylmethionine-8-amino-7-oxononanoate aminotransferase